MKVRRMCGGPCWPWQRTRKGRFGFLRPRNVDGAWIVDNIGLAFVYRDGCGW